MATLAGAALLVAASVGVGYAAHRLFCAHRVSDVLPLVGFGLVVGALLPAGEAARMAPGFEMLAPLGLVLILFEGGLGLSWAELRHVAARALAAALGTWALTAAALAATARLALGLSGDLSILLGVALAGPGVTALLPLLPRLGLPPAARAFVTIETTLGSTLNAVSTTAAVGVLAAQTTPALAFGSVSWRLLVGAAVGVLAGVAAARAMRRVEGAHAWGFAVAGLLGAYVAAEALGGSGFLMALAFGLVLGNVRPLGSEARGVNHEAIFLFRSAYFVFLGVLVAPHLEARHVLGGLALVGAILAVRLATMGVLRAGGGSLLSVTLAPRGLSTALGASLPVAMGVAEAAEMLPYVFCVVVGANVVTTVGMRLHARSARDEKTMGAAAAVALVGPRG